MAYEPTPPEAVAMLDEYRSRVPEVPRITGTDEHGYAALVFFWESGRRKLSPIQQQRLHERGFRAEQLDEFARFDPTASDPRGVIRVCCAIAEALIALESDGGRAFDMHRALG